MNRNEKSLVSEINSNLRIGILASVVIHSLLTSAAIVVWQDIALREYFDDTGSNGAARISAALNLGNEALIVSDLNRFTSVGPVFAARVLGPDINYSAIRRGFENATGNLLIPPKPPASSFVLERYVQRSFSLSSAQSIKGEYTFTITADRFHYLPKLLAIQIFLLILACISYFTLTAYTRRIAKRISFPFSNLANYLKEVGLREKFTTQSSDHHVQEFTVLVESLTSAQDELIAYQKRINELSVGESMGRLASQVAHDIRSPLAALDVGIRDLGQLPEENRIIIRSAVNRIRDIANDLLDRNRSEKSSAPIDSTAPNAVVPHLVSALLDSIVSEKRLQYRPNEGIDIELHLEASSYGLFAAINDREFKRVVSNLINNAIEAFENSGRVDISLSGAGAELEVKISDNGHGIAADVLPKLMQTGETHGKAGGTGLGLHHARTSIEAWRGRITIDSAPGKGTTITLRLPRVAAPHWFVASLVIPPGGTVAVIDDDPSVRQIWRGRLEALGVARHNITLRYFATPSELSAWLAASNDPEQTKSQTLFLCDFEFLGQGENGLDLIERLGIAARSILVTSRYEEPSVRKISKRLGVKLIPKGMAGLVPIEFRTPPTRYHAVLIDDDPLVHQMWNFGARAAQKRLLTFATPQEFYAVADSVDRATPIYVDFHLGDGVSGGTVTEIVSKLGFHTIYLATGSQVGELPQMPWIKAVVGKEPPRWE